MFPSLASFPKCFRKYTVTEGGIVEHFQGRGGLKFTMQTLR